MDEDLLDSLCAPAPPLISARLSVEPPGDVPDGLLSLAVEAAPMASTASADFPSAAADEDRCLFIPGTATYISI